MSSREECHLCSRILEEDSQWTAVCPDCGQTVILCDTCELLVENNIKVKCGCGE